MCELQPFGLRLFGLFLLSFGGFQCNMYNTEVVMYFIHLSLVGISTLLLKGTDKVILEPEHVFHIHHNPPSSISTSGHALLALLNDLTPSHHKCGCSNPQGRDRKRGSPLEPQFLDLLPFFCPLHPFSCPEVAQAI